jgi:superfamily I DNA/RNA helicase
MDQLLTGAQLQIVLSLNSSKRAVVSGGAGTGKTLIATEIARNHSRAHESVLFLTQSEPLEIYLNKLLESESNVDVRNISEIEDIEELGRVWDLVVVDEAQDVDWSTWHRLENLSKEDGKLFIFMDSNQSIYRIAADLSTQLNAEAFELNINLRNTRYIAKATESLYRGPLIHAPGPTGEMPKIIRAENFNLAMKECASLIAHLRLSESVQFGEIVVLTRDKNSRDKLKYELGKQGFMTCNAGERNLGFLCVETVPRFKGLESPVVIAISDSEWANNTEMSYVAITRARSRFFLIGNTSGTIFNRALSSISVA